MSVTDVLTDVLTDERNDALSDVIPIVCESSRSAASKIINTEIVENELKVYRHALRLRGLERKRVIADDRNGRGLERKRVRTE